MTENLIMIRPFESEEWPEFKAIRLRALCDNRGVFLGKYEDAVSKPDEYWKDLITADNGQVFALFDARKLIGLTSIFCNLDKREIAGLGMSYIDPAYRGQKLSRLFYEARINWARQNGVKEIYVSHREGNDASKNANQAFGFELFKQEEIAWPDGQRAIDYVYRLVL